MSDNAKEADGNGSGESPCYAVRDKVWLCGSKEGDAVVIPAVVTKVNATTVSIIHGVVYCLKTHVDHWVWSRIKAVSPKRLRRRTDLFEQLNEYENPDHEIPSVWPVAPFYR